MNKLNNKGQSLVMFVLMIPLFLMIMVLVIDVGNVILKKQELNNINYLAIDYGLDHLNDKDLETNLFQMINLNIKGSKDISIDIENNTIKINIKKTTEGVLGRIISIDGYKINSTYKGTIKKDKKDIERVK